MVSAQYNRYIWLVDTIRSAGKITRAEIDRKWMNSHYNETHETTFPDRSFFRCKKDILSIFDIDIKCKRSREGSVYYIANPDDDPNSQTKQWLLSQFALSQSLDASRELQDQIIYEHIPEGTEYLTTIVEALRDHKKLLISHLRFDTDQPHVFYMAPLCLKVFKQRWYVLGFIEELDGSNKTGNEPRTYALDRVKHLELTDKTFKQPKDFHPQEFFLPYYGVFCGSEYKPEIVRARVATEKDAKYLRTLPLHHSQREPEPCVFEWFIAPTFDFIQQLRTYGPALEVLAPQSLRDSMRQDAEAVANLYK